MLVMQNIEIKAKYENLEWAAEIAQRVGAKFEGTLRQKDTYFHVGKGRLKLREINSAECQLIYYERPNEAAAKFSEYQIYSVNDASCLRQLLESALGSWCVVEKERRLYRYDEVRIHLDAVKNLGTFVEFEGVLSIASDPQRTRNKVNWLVSQFALSRSDFVEGSYSDLFAGGTVKREK